MNKFGFLGRLTKDVELKENGEMKIATITIAVTRKNKNKNGEYESDFFRVSAFGKQAEFANNFFNKGSWMLVLGTIQNSSYEANGERKYITNYIANEIDFAGDKKVKEEVEEPNDFIQIDDTEELPF